MKIDKIIPKVHQTTQGIWKGNLKPEIIESLSGTKRIRGGAEREGERENPKQAPHCQCAEPSVGLELMNCEIMT